MNCSMSIKKQLLKMGKIYMKTDSLIEKLRAIKPSPESPEISEHVYAQAIEDCIEIIMGEWHSADSSLKGTAKSIPCKSEAPATPQGSEISVVDGDFERWFSGVTRTELNGSSLKPAAKKGWRGAAEHYSGIIAWYKKALDEANAHHEQHHLHDIEAMKPVIGRVQLEKCARAAAAAYYDDDGDMHFTTREMYCDRAWNDFIKDAKAVLDAAGVKYHED
jgi:hypothetical protein